MRPYLFSSLLLCSILFPDLIAQCPPATATGVHVVQKGETLFGISRLYGITVKQLKSLNQLTVADEIYPCQQLVVFLSGPQALAPAPATYGSSPAMMNPANITARGIALPTTNQVPTRQAGSLHVVRTGETMAQLASAYGYTEERFREFNGFSSFQEPNPGTTVRSEHCNCSAGTSTANQLATPTTFSRSPVVGNSFSAPNTSTNLGGTPLNNSFLSSTANNASPTNTVIRDDRSYLRTDESAMIDEINLMRSNPAGYVAFVEDFVRNYPAVFRRQIDRRYVNSLISDLQNTPPLSRLVAHPCLYQVARGHGQYLRSINQLVHNGAGGSTPQSRTQSICPSVQLGTSRKANGYIVGNENLVGGYTTPREAVIGLLIDEGLQTPGHRETLLAPEWRYVGISNFGTSGGFPNNYVQLFGR